MKTNFKKLSIPIGKMQTIKELYQKNYENSKTEHLTNVCSLWA